MRTGKPFYLQSFYERTKYPASGLKGGKSGAAGRLSANADPQPIPKITSVVQPGVVVKIELPGGGGFGQPLARDPASVLVDVRNGYVSPQSAERDYGVVIDTTKWVVDTAATRAKREAMGAL